MMKSETMSKFTKLNAVGGQPLHNNETAAHVARKCWRDIDPVTVISASSVEHQASRMSTTN
jgi:hypothetical protein